jgi:hypothetical protein
MAVGCHRVGPIRPVLTWIVRSVAGSIVTSHLRPTIDDGRQLYVRRGAACMLDDPHRPEQWSDDKVVTAHRSGWCCELNGAPAGLPAHLGFVVDTRCPA